MNVAFEDDFIVLADEFREILQVIIWPVVIVGLVANLAVILRILLPIKSNKNSNLKPFYRSSLISLAVADLLMILASGTNTLSILSSKTFIWNLSSTACTLIPYLQTVAMIVASLNLAFVAIDRFAAIQPRLPPAKPSNSLGILIMIIIITWSIALGSSYPVLNIYTSETVTIITNSTAYTAALCIVNDRNSAATIYTALFTVIFLPLATVFILVYILLARSIYKKKFPGNQSTGGSISQEISTASTSITTSAPKPVKNKKIPMHVIRKRRTVRVILILIGVFVLCRMPQWSFLVTKLYIKVSHKFWWHLQVILTLLSLINAAVHPFLYAFLNEALSLVTWINSLCIKSTSKESSKNIPDSITVKIPRSPYAA
ncbi:orexin receptor type 2 [Microplitis demolitor]|uniref:orexin receptor type 2 n=1 Tax=Microplitis demolitor TaxID=69319 RepID=UPI0004CCFFE7|nr:orexin receptor type 2 [Microplitis demolitor]